MDVMVTESDPGAADEACRQLAAANHSIHRCHDPGNRAFPCNGLTGECPLEATAIDVVLDARARTRTWPTPLEDGVTCALRRHVPVVVAGRASLNPFEEHGAVVADGDDVVAACEAAAFGALPRHGEVATEALRLTLERAGVPTDGASATVVRRNGRLRAELTVPPAAPPAVRRTAEVRVLGALRRYDTDSTGVDVGCRILETA